MSEISKNQRLRMNFALGQVFPEGLICIACILMRSPSPRLRKGNGADMLVRCRMEGPLDSKAKAVKLLRNWLARRNKVDRNKEHFWVIGLDTALHIKYIEVVTIGTVDASLVHAREVYRYAIMQGVSSLILGHNHPSGIVKPSADDRKATKRLAKAGNIIGIRIIDHLIIGLDGQHFSFAVNLPNCLEGK
jgi:DNA repair protein RadC